MLNFVIGFFVGALTLYVAICVYYYIKIKNMEKMENMKTMEIIQSYNDMLSDIDVEFDEDGNIIQ